MEQNRSARMKEKRRKDMVLLECLISLICSVIPGSSIILGSPLLFSFDCFPTKVTAVESGSRALQYLGFDGERNSAGFDGLKVNLIITDYSMPGMTGYELLKKIKGSTKLNQIPVVIMSSENVLARIDRCMEEGAEEFLVKPVKLADVERLRQFMLRGEEDSNQRVAGRRKRKPMDDDDDDDDDDHPLQKHPRLI